MEATTGIQQLWLFGALVTVDVAHDDHRPEDQFRIRTQDLYTPAGDIGFWQAAPRDVTGDLHSDIANAVREREPITSKLLYTDQAGAQPRPRVFTPPPAKSAARSIATSGAQRRTL